LSLPYWVVSLEAHTAWKGLVQRQHRTRLDSRPGSDFLVEKDQFKRNYRWAVSGRDNICESWGMTRLHEPKEALDVRWDGFPLDSTFSRGQLQDPKTDKSAYDSREFFEFKFSNGLAIVGVQVNEEEALRRARLHVEQYHLELSRLNVDHLTDFRTEVEVAGIQLIHLPFWHATFVYRPRTTLRHFYRPKEKHVLLEGYNNGVLAGELPIRHKDKLWVNAVICGIGAVVTGLLGLVWHPAFLLVAAFALIVAGGSAYVATARANAGSDEAMAANDAGKPAAAAALPGAKKPATARAS
jgi:hypothetical protein